MNGSRQNVSSEIPSEEIYRLYRAGFSLLPLGGGTQGKSPLCSFKGVDRLPLKRVLGPMYERRSACYGLRLCDTAVVDCDVNDSALIKQLEVRFGASPVHVVTPRGLHLYYRFEGGLLPNLRGEDLPVDIKSGASSYVVGPHSIRPDSGAYYPVKGVLGVDALPPIRSQKSLVRTKSGAIETGSRNRELCTIAINWVEAVETPDELFDNLAFFRDDECEDPTTIPDDELRGIANWAWNKRLEGKVYRDRDSDFSVNRSALDRLAEYENASDATALFVTLLAHHGHQPGKTFTIDYYGMRNANHTSLSRERFLAARRSLQGACLLEVAKEYSVGKSSRRYRLQRARYDLPKVQSLFTPKEAS